MDQHQAQPDVGKKENAEPLYLSERPLLHSSDHHLIQMSRELYRTVFENVENGFTHNPYSHEARECACIRQGDVAGLRLVLEERYPGRYGKLSEDPLRQEIYMGIVAVTLASRAAIEGGVHYETSFYLSDICIQRLDASRSVEEILALTKGAQILYAVLVRELLTKREGDRPQRVNRHVSRSKDYIFAHLHGKVTVQEIADFVGLDANYLSVLFRRSEHVSLKRFIMHEKIALAKNMLAYSDYSYAQIAHSLGFTSQSHMGVEFKKVTGMTPSAYRMANAQDDSVQDSMEIPVRE